MVSSSLRAWWGSKNPNLHDTKTRGNAKNRGKFSLLLPAWAIRMSGRSMAVVLVRGSKNDIGETCHGNVNLAPRGLRFTAWSCVSLTRGIVCQVPAIVLVVVLSVSPITPWSLAPDQDSDLPACCRGDGAHGCAMAAAAETPSSDFSIRSPLCPSFPGARAIPPRAKVGLLQISQTASAVISHRQPPKAQNKSVPRTIFRCSHPKRGPPPLPSC